MIVFNNRNIKKAIKNLFRDKLDLIDERKKNLNSLINIHTDFFREIKSEKEKKLKLLSENKISQFQSMIELAKHYESYAIEKELFMNTKGKELLKEYNKKYGSGIEVKGIKNEIKLEFEPTIYKEAYYEESLKYEKNYDCGDFIMDFFYDDNNKLEFLDISVYDNTGNFLNAVIDLKIESRVSVLSFFQIVTRNIKLDINFGSEVEKKFLKSLKEEDLLTLDSKEKEDYYLMLLDFKIDLKDEPLYEMFKMGVSDFSILIKKGLSPKDNRNTTRVHI